MEALQDVRSRPKRRNRNPCRSALQPNLQGALTSCEDGRWGQKQKVDGRVETSPADG